MFDSCIYIKLYINVCIPEMQSVSIDTKVANLILNPEKVYSIQHYVIRLDSMFWQVVAFLCVLEFPLSIELKILFNNVKSGNKQ